MDYFLSEEKLNSVECIESRILLLRGRKVILSAHLAELYQVEPKVLMQAVKRNLNRFPTDFMFQLTWEESSEFLQGHKL